MGKAAATKMDTSIAECRHPGGTRGSGRHVVIALDVSDKDIGAAVLEAAGQSADRPVLIAGPCVARAAAISSAVARACGL